MATGLTSPRNIYTLPNGDVLVVESKGPGLEPSTRPKDYVMNYFLSKAHGRQKPAGPSNRIVLLRDTNGDGIADVGPVP